MNTTLGLTATTVPWVRTSMETRWIVLGVLLFAISPPGRANDGVLDVTCGIGGKVTVDLFGSTSNQANAIAIQADGKIVVAGTGSEGSSDFALARYNPDGSLDASFGSGGLVTTDFSGDTDGAAAVAIQSDGKIVVAGFARTDATRRDFAVARYTASGALDLSFGSGGKVTMDFSNSVDQANGLAIQPDGKIVVAGSAHGQFALARYDAGGTPDASFGAGGKVTTAILGIDDEAFALALQADGKIVAAGFAVVGGANSDFALVRYSGADGSLDTSFGVGGVVTSDFAGGDDEAFALGIQADGKIVAAGLALSGTSSYDFALARYGAADGSLDSSFGTGGKVTTDLAGGSDQIGSLVIQSDGKLLAAGSTAGGAGHGDMALARYDGSVGSLDPSFGTGGTVVTDYAGGADSAHAIAILAAGRILAVGTATGSATGRDFALARYLADGTPDAAWGAAGKVTTDLIGSTPNVVHAVAIQTDGKVVTAGNTPRTGGDFALARFNTNGSLDGSFGVGGMVLTDFAGGGDDARAVLIQPDGKIVAAGLGFNPAVSTFSFALARYAPDGSLDPTFGNGGRVFTVVVGHDDEGYAIALQADNKIVVAGLSGDPATGGSVFALSRYNSDGSPDATFGTGGTLTTIFTGVLDEAFSVAIQADQKIVAAGNARVDIASAPTFALARYNTDGTLDSGFGSGGLVTTSFFGNDDEAVSIAIQADQKIVASGYAVDGVPKFALARYNPDGTLDSGFGTGGLVTTSILGNDDESFAVAIQRDQKIVVTGYALATEHEFAVARFNSDGTLDSSFGQGGLVTTSIVGVNDQALASAIQADGRIVAAGFSVGNTTGADFALARYFVCDFLDVAASHPFHDFICSIDQAGVTAGCGGGNYCPAGSVTRAQMAVFLLKSEHGFGYVPSACAGVFPDVPCPSPFADWVEQLAAEGVTAGCGGGLYCPGNPVTRRQMAVFLLKTKEGSGYAPPPAAGIFGDVPQADTFAPWIEELYSRQITGGCQASPLLYCPDNPNTRGQMAVFLVKTFGLEPYGP